MTLEEKIGQKIMLDFRYWDPSGKNEQDMLTPDATIQTLIKENHIGGVILFANNLKSKIQIKRLTDWYAEMKVGDDIGLLIGTDNEGGNVFRLPRSDYASFTGNMALAAAIEGGADIELATAQGSQIAQDMLSLNINTNFAPVVDVNTNPLNPVINIRAFSDDVNTVSRLAEQMATGMSQQGLITVYKHFPGHGSTSTDSHTGLPRVDRSRKDAFSIDMAPYRQAINNKRAPDMIMTAHIQYPALDNCQIITRNGTAIMVPATMSWEIQTRILRNKLGYSGVTISDALNMQAITGHFSYKQAVENVFAAGVDIALMPVSISSPDQAMLLPDLIQHIVEQVKKGRIREADIDASVGRILSLKEQHNLLGKKAQESDNAPLPSGFSLAKQIADRSVTVVINQNSVLPLKDKNLRYFILTPQEEQAKGIAVSMSEEGYLNVVAAYSGELTAVQVKAHIAESDVFLFGTMSSNYTPVERDGNVTADTKSIAESDPYSDWLQYAQATGKKRVHLSLRAPYHIVRYADESDAAVATYSYEGYANGLWSGHSMQSLAEVLTGKRPPQGKLPVNIWYEFNQKTNTGTVAFPRGYGLEWGKQVDE